TICEQTRIHKFDNTSRLQLVLDCEHHDDDSPIFSRFELCEFIVLVRFQHDSRDLQIFQQAFSDI
ncbi:MAG: hypothetical protein ACKO96_49165, partial [Flammeovirgaceae bacterium]